MIKNIHIIYFSPTNTTKTILKSILKGVEAESYQELDIAEGVKEEHTIKDGLVVIGVPVYSGRIPVTASEQLRKIKGVNSKAVLVAVYGNRHYDDTLVEMEDIAQENGFRTIAAAAFIGEHSFSTEKFPIAPNRPDKEDLQKAKQFGAQIKSVVEDGKEPNLQIPGNRPYKDLPQYPDVAPLTDESKCDKCGVCVDVCPTNAISINGSITTDARACIKCCACVKECSNYARYNDNDMINGASEKLFKFCSERREPELFV